MPKAIVPSSSASGLLMPPPLASAGMSQASIDAQTQSSCITAFPQGLIKKLACLEQKDEKNE
jgi:hypothetical protein